MLHVLFTPGDLLRVRLAAAPAPLVEAGLALALLRAGSTDPVLARWRRGALPSLTPPVRSLLELLRPDTGLGPLFLDPPLANADEAVALVAATPREEAARELRRVLGDQRVVPPRAVALSRGEPRAWRELETALTAAHRDFLRPWWPQMQAGFAADVTWRSQVLATDGLRALLSGLVTGSSWSGSVLRLPSARDRELRLSGAGVTLVPSLLWRGAPLWAWAPDGSLLLVYPALRALSLVPPPDASTDPLAALLGPTRAQVLQLLARPQTTGGLAQQLGISPASASGHAKTLRAAGLVTTSRDGKFVRHACTPLGARLLGGG